MENTVTVNGKTYTEDNAKIRSGVNFVLSLKEMIEKIQQKEDIFLKLNGIERESLKNYNAEEREILNKQWREFNK
jgi:Zn-dependent oligopeptidase